ncbi:urease subunit gamma [Kitasatospora purpeofusca]|uniref:urease subunit gamma n=1 Tax=Kitasatospora purpeofusca TaxID=67352 RepID=UPI003660DFE6
MQLTPTERDRLLIFTAAELARARRARGLRLNVPEATALISDTVCEAARDGLRLAEAVARGRSVLGADDVLPGVPDLVTEIQVEAVFEDGTRLAVITDPFGGGGLASDAPGAVLTEDRPEPPTRPVRTLAVRNTAEVPVSVTSHYHFFETNPRLAFDRAAAYGMRLAVPAGSSVRFDPDTTVEVGLVPIGGERVAIGFAGLVDGPLDSPRIRREALRRAAERGYLGAEPDHGPEHGPDTGPDTGSENRPGSRRDNAPDNGQENRP